MFQGTPPGTVCNSMQLGGASISLLEDHPQARGAHSPWIIPGQQRGPLTLRPQGGTGEQVTQQPEKRGQQEGPVPSPPMLSRATVSSIAPTSPADKGSRGPSFVWGGGPGITG